MAELIRTKIYPMVYDAHTSEQIGELRGQQRLAYNFAVDELRANRNLTLRRERDYRTAVSIPGLLERTLDWSRGDERIDAPRDLILTGAQAAWIDNDLLRRKQEFHAYRDSEPGPDCTGPRHLSRKNSSSTLTSNAPPVRIDADTFTLRGRRDVLLRAREIVPDDLDIRSFKLVEVRRERRGRTGPLRSRRYALHLDVAIECPDPADLDTIVAADEILGIDDGLPERLAMSDGSVLVTDDSDTSRRERRLSLSISRKNRGSKRRRKLERHIRNLSRRTMADTKRLALNRARELYREVRPVAIAIECRDFRARKRPASRTRVNLQTDTTRQAQMMEAALSDRVHVMQEEAQKLGIRVYTLLPLHLTTSRCGCECRHRTDRESQASSWCSVCGHETSRDLDVARLLQQRAFSYIRPDITEGAPVGRRVKPPRGARETPCDPLGASKPNGGLRQQFSTELSPQGNLRNVPSTAHSPRGRGARRQLVSPKSRKYIITDETLAIVNMISDANLADRTKVNCAVGFALWATWAVINGHPVVPARDEHLTLCLLRFAERGYSADSIRDICAASTRYHHILGLSDPVTDIVKNTMRSIATKHTGVVKQADGLRKEHLDAIARTVFAPLGNERAEEAQMRGLRTLALLHLMRVALLRMAEAHALVWSDISEAENGSGRVLIQRSKSDQHGKGVLLYVPAQVMNLLAAIRGEAKDHESVFGWSYQAMRRRITQAGRRAGLGVWLTGHSARRGAAQELSRKGATMKELQEAGRWDHPEQAARYAFSDDPEDSPVYRFYKKIKRDMNRRHSGQEPGEDIQPSDAEIEDVHDADDSARLL